MKIKELTLFTKKKEKEQHFYGETLGFQILENTSDSFAVKIGQSKLTFQASKDKHVYHYCFLIPCNQLKEAIKWLKQRLDLIDIENGRVVQHFENWNADSIYFYDGSGNLAEFIVRHDLKNDRVSTFGLPSILSINEIGMPTKDIQQLNNQLESDLDSQFWKGDKERFGTNGTQEGLFLLPNYEVKKIWFPTTITVQPSPFNAIIEQDANIFNILFENKILKINRQHNT